MTMIRRTGTTLMEVLVAIFVMSIGLLSVLTLFPLGAMNMAQAIKDDRTADAAQEATAIAKFRNVRGDSTVIAAPGYAAGPIADGPSIPVYVDPAAVKAGATAKLGGTIPRKGVSFAASAGDIARWFTFIDDIHFGENGVPNPSGNGAIERENRYSWAYLVRLPRSGTKDYATADLTVVVYDRRPLVVTSGGKLAGETTCNAKFDTSSPVVTLSWTGTVPNIRKGSWILDATVKPEVHGYFYRVVSATQTSPTSMDVELQTYPKASGAGTVVVMENVAEVFEKGAN